MQENPAEQVGQSAPVAPEVQAVNTPIEPSLPPEAPTDAMVTENAAPEAAPVTLPDVPQPAADLTIADSAEASSNVIGMPPGPLPEPAPAPTGTGFTNNLGPSTVTTPAPAQLQEQQALVDTTAALVGQEMAGSVTPAPATTVESPIAPPPASPETTADSAPVVPDSVPPSA